jgi:hypothetical protein
MAGGSFGRKLVVLVTTLAVASALVGVGLCLGRRYPGLLPPNATATVTRLANLARCDKSLNETRTELIREDLPLARAYVFLHPDRSSCGILLDIRRLDLPTYVSIDESIRARILVSWLAFASTIDEWGWLNDEFSWAESGTAVLEVGAYALPLLEMVLDDESRIDSDEGQVNATYERICARRKDFAYKYICLILKKHPAYSPNPQERDRDIEALKVELKKTNGP